MRRLRIALFLASLTAVVVAASAVAFGVVEEPLPVGVVGTPYSYQFKVNGGNPPYTFKVDTGGLPPGISLSSSGLLSGTPTQAGSWEFYIDGSYQFGSNPPAHSQRHFTLDVVVGLNIQQTSLPVLVQGAAYSTQLTASGGGTQTWSVSSGTLPAGVGLASNGVLSGTPTQTGTFTFTVKVTDGTRTDTQALTAEVVQALVASAPAFPPAVVGSQFTATLTATGGRQPYTWSIKEGAWPKGLTLSNGTITGAPRVAGTYAFTAAVTDALGQVATVPMTLVVNPRLKILLQTIKPGVVGKVYRNLIVAKGGAAPLTFELAFGDLPPGVRLNAKTGALVGKPRVKGRYSFQIVVTDQLGNTHQRSFVLRVK